MTPEFVVTLSQQAIRTLLILILPLMGVGLVVGLLVSIFQAVTQLQEMTLTFIPKIVAVFIVLLLLSPWMIDVASEFTREMFIHIPEYAR